MKYLITKQNRVFTFPDFISHSTIAKAKNIKSAGFVKAKNNQIVTYGRSKSTGVKSNPDDAKLVIRKLGRDERRRLQNYS